MLLNFTSIVGVMGYGNKLDDDRKCYNAVKSWFFGWFEEAHLELDPTDSTFEGNIVGMANFDQRGNDYVIIKIIGHDDNNDYYVSFNRRIGMNLGSTEGGDKVIINSANAINKFDTTSSQIKQLSEGDYYSIDNFGGGDLTLYIMVKHIMIKNSPGYAHVLISLQEPGTLKKDSKTMRNGNKRKKIKETKKKKKRNDTKKNRGTEKNMKGSRKKRNKKKRKNKSK